MHVLIVNIKVKEEAIDAFKAASLNNAKNSMLEAGVLRFDVYQQPEDKTRFMLVEVYHEVEDHAKHRETAHYKTWRDTVEPMMADARVGTKYINVFPADADWK